jgi:hypothetical protein
LLAEYQGCGGFQGRRRVIGGLDDCRKGNDLRDVCRIATDHDDTRIVIADSKSDVGEFLLKLLTWFGSETEYDNMTSFYKAKVSGCNSIPSPSAK